MSLREWLNLPSDSDNRPKVEPLPKMKRGANYKTQIKKWKELSNQDQQTDSEES